jgi:hypothetical protein
VPSKMAPMDFVSAVIPLLFWLVFVGTAVPGVLFAAEFLRDYFFPDRHAVEKCRRWHGQCPACGYPLTGNKSGVCPECGAPARNVTPSP